MSIRAVEVEIVEYSKSTHTLQKELKGFADGLYAEGKRRKNKR